MIFEGACGYIQGKREWASLIQAKAETEGEKAEGDREASYCQGVRWVAGESCEGERGLQTSVFCLVGLGGSRNWGRYSLLVTNGSPGCCRF